MAFKSCNQLRDWHGASVPYYPALFTLHFYDHLRDDRILHLPNWLRDQVGLVPFVPQHACKKSSLLSGACKAFKFGIRQPLYRLPPSWRRALVADVLVPLPCLCPCCTWAGATLSWDGLGSCARRHCAIAPDSFPPG